MFRRKLPALLLGILTLACASPTLAAVMTTNVTVTGAGPYSINYILAQQATTLVANIYTASGTLIQSLDMSLDPGLTSPGKHDASGVNKPAIIWDGTKSDGNPAPKGTYYAEIVTTGDPMAAPTLLSVATLAKMTAATEARNTYGGDANRNPNSQLHNLTYFAVCMTNANGSHGYDVVSADASSINFAQDGASGAYDYVCANVMTDDTILLGGQGKKKLRNVKAVDGTLIADYAAGKIDTRTMQTFGAGATARTYFVDDQTPNGPLTGSIGLLDPISNTTGTPIYQTIITRDQIDAAAGLAAGTVPMTRALVVNRAETSIWLCGAQASASGIHFLQRYDKVGGVWQQNTSFVPTVDQTMRLSGLALSPDETVLYMTHGSTLDANLCKVGAFHPATGADIPEQTYMTSAIGSLFTPVGITTTASDANHNAQTSYNLVVTGYRSVLGAVSTANSVAIIAPMDNGSNDKTRSDFFDVVLGATAVSVTSGPTVSNVTDTTATVTWGTDFRSGSVVHYGGEAGVYNMPDASSIETTTSHTVNLAGLVPGMTYYFQVESARDPLTPGTATGSFTTTPRLRVVSETLTAAADSAVLNVNTNVACDVLVHWGDTSASFNKPDITVTGGTSHAVNFTGLAAGTTYYYQLVLSGSNAIGTTTATSAFATAATTGSAGTVTDTDLLLGRSVNLLVSSGSAALPVQGVPGAPVLSTALPGPVYEAGAVAYNGYLYAIGGSDAAGTATTDVRYIKIAADGSLDPNGWQFSTTPLPQARTAINGMVTAYNGRIYVAGGLDAASPAVSQTSVLYAVQNPATGDLGPWMGLDEGGAAINPMPAARYRGSATVLNGNLVVSGGLIAGSTRATNYTASFKPDGSLGTWFDAGALNDSRYSNRSVVNASTMYSIGGQVSTGLPNTTVDVAAVQPMGSLTTFTKSSAYPGHADSTFDPLTGRRGVATSLVSGKLVTVGGLFRVVFSGDLTGTKLISYARIASDDVPQTWVDAISTDPNAVLINNLADTDGAAYNANFYVVGGRTVNTYGSGVSSADTAVTDVLVVPMYPDPNDTGYALSGTLESKVIDLGAVTNLKHIKVNGSGVSASSVEVRYRFANADGVFTDYYTLDGVDTDVTGGARYVQYLLVLKGGTSTPTVNSVTITTAAGVAGPLTTADVKKALAIAAGLETATGADMTRLNVDGVGGITALDATKIQRTINGR